MTAAGQADAVLGLSGVVVPVLVGVAGGLVDAAAGCSPDHVAGPGLGELPSVGLLAPVVMPAQGRMRHKDPQVWVNL